MTFTSTFASRRWRNGAITLIVIAAIAAVAWLYHLALRDVSFLTGWLLLGSTVVLALFNGRKKLAIVPLLSAAAWLQFHVYLGVTALALFLMHTEFRWPTGGLDTALWVLFVTLAVTGAIGLALSRFIPPRLARGGERISFERIPILRARLADRVEGLAARSVEEARTDIVAKYYVHTLLPFMAGSRNLPRHLCGSRRALGRLHQELGSLHRSLDDPGKALVDDIREAVTDKDDLDFQHAWQLALKGWLFVHVPLTWALLILAMVHVTLVHSFGADTL